MASTISAGTTSGTAIAIAGDTSGNLAFTTQAGTYTQTVPNATGTVMVSGNMPAFSAYLTTNPSLTAGTGIKVAFDNKTGGTGNAVQGFDTAGCYNNTGSTVTLNGITVPSYSFAPNVAGYYYFTVTLGIYYPTSGVYILNILRKNGGNIIVGEAAGSGGTAEVTCPCSGIIYMNGTSDYVNVFAQTGSSGCALDSGSNGVWSGYLVRAA
jgi:hypothetical protein